MANEELHGFYINWNKMQREHYIHGVLHCTVDLAYLAELRSIGQGYSCLTADDLLKMTPEQVIAAIG